MTATLAGHTESAASERLQRTEEPAYNDSEYG